MSNADMRKTVAANSSYLICYFLIFLSFLISMRCWIGWNGRNDTITYFISTTLVIMYLLGKIRLDFKYRYVMAFLIYILVRVLISGYTKITYIGLITFRELPIFFILCISDERKIECLEYITKYYAYILVPGIIIYLLLFFVYFPPLGTLVTESSQIGIQSDRYLYRSNYIFYEPTAIAGAEKNRFNGPFHEPGYLGMICAFLLFANQFEFKKKKHLWIILISLALSLSLAGYVLSFIGYLMILIYNKKISSSSFFIYVFLVGGLYYFGLLYNGGDNFMNNSILSRLQFDEEMGISGNNRLSNGMYEYFLLMFGDTHTLLFGYDKETTSWLIESGSGGTGLLYWIVLHGIIGSLLAFVFYFYLFLKSKAKSFAFLAFVFVFLMFLQRSYPFWSSWIILYVYSIVMAERKKNYF